MARLGARITKLEATRPKWRAFRLDPDTLSQQAREALAAAYGATVTSDNPDAFLDTLRDHLAAAQGPDGLDMGKLSDADLEAIVALGEEMAL
jgi:hypothetical protein